MALSINPLAIAVGAIAVKAASDAANANSAKGIVEAAAGSKAALDEVVAKAGGGVNSGLNMGAAMEAAQAANSTLGKLGQSLSDTPFGGVADAIGTLRATGADIAGGLDKLVGGDLAGGIKDIAGGISKSAGSLNDILSLKRASNLPAGAELFTTQGGQVKVNPVPKGDWRVRISANWNILNSPKFLRLKETGGVVFPFTPSVSFTTSAEYSSTEPLHSNYPFQSFKTARVEDITITGDFSVQTSKDAEYWLAATRFFRTATKMFYGKSEAAGNPPIICHLSGYGSQIFDRVPIVITTFNLEFPSDIDYIKSADGTWVPSLSTLVVTTRPVYNRSQLRQFSLQQYAQGNMISPSGGNYI